MDFLGSGFCEVHDVAAGAAGASVTDVTGIVDNASRVVGKGMDIVDATSLVIVASGLMATV